MSKKSKETEALLEEEVQNEGIQTLAGEPNTGTGTANDSDDDSTVDDTTPSDPSDDDDSTVDDTTPSDPSSDNNPPSTTEIPSNFNLSYFWNHYGYIEQNSFTSYIQQLEDGTADSGSGDGDSTGVEGTEPGPEEGEG